MHFPKLKLIRLFALVLFLLPLSIASAADAPRTRLQDATERRVAREKAFFMRSSDELGRTLLFANETIVVLNEQVDGAAQGLGTGNKANERLGLLEWYQKYADWLSGMSAELDLEMNNYFLRQQADPGSARYDELAKGSRKLANELDERALKLEEEKKKLEARMRQLNAVILDRRIPVGKDALQLARELSPANRDNPRDRQGPRYRDLTDDEVLYFQNELRLDEERQKYFECLAELEKYEEAWLFLKAGEFEKLYDLARVIGGQEPGRLAYAFRGAIRTYEADRAALKRKTAELGAKIHNITGTGTLGTLDRLEELSRYYEKMKYRYERHIEWLGAQIGSYQADLIELGKEQ
jgi:hypothetical protein